MDFGSRPKTQAKRKKSRKRSTTPHRDVKQPYEGEGNINLMLGQSSQSKIGSIANFGEGREVAKQSQSPSKMTGHDPDKVHIKKQLDPSLFKIKVPKKHLEHLIADDIDEISKYEVIYKILKDQLRDHQSALIKMKKDKNKRDKSPDPTGVSKMEIQEFTRQMKEIEFHGSQRDLSPELKRIVKNLTC